MKHQNFRGERQLLATPHPPVREVDKRRMIINSFLLHSCYQRRKLRRQRPAAKTQQQQTKPNEVPATDVAQLVLQVGSCSMVVHGYKRRIFGVSIFGVSRNHETLKTKQLWYCTKHLWYDTNIGWYNTKGII